MRVVRRVLNAEDVEGLRKVAVMMERAGINPALPVTNPVDVEAQRQRLFDQARMIRENQP